MDIILRIYFIGLIAFVPSQDGRDMTVIVERARDGHRTVDGHHVEPHLPLLFARGNCKGDCQPDASRIAKFLYEIPGGSNTQDSLRQLDHATESGAAWILEDVELKIELSPQAETGRLVYGPSPGASTKFTLPASTSPTSDRDARSFGWIAQMSHIVPASATILAGVLEGDPTLGLVAARMVLDRGSLQSFSLIEIDGKIAPLTFQPRPAALPGTPPRAFTSWVALDIPLSVEACKDGIGVRARPLASGPERAMKIKPTCTPGSTIEMAIVNLPAWEGSRRSGKRVPSPHGPHFELFYKLAQNWPAPSDRRVPVLPNPVKMLDPKIINYKQPPSPLLSGLHLLQAKGVYAQPICVPVAFDPPADGD